MNIIILGCGRVGSTLAKELSLAGHSVSIIDLTSDAFRRLGSKFKGQKIVGTGLDADTLEKAGIRNADVFFAVTQGDNSNIMAAQIAKEVYNIPKVLARIYDPVRSQAYGEMGIITLCTTTLAAGYLRAEALGTGEADAIRKAMDIWDREYLGRLS
jgi:trk system potassium uptake protein TrkA